MLKKAPFAPLYLPLFQSYQDEYLSRLATLVDIDSGTGQVEGVNLVMDYLQQWLIELGCQVELYPSPDYGNNLIARHMGRGGRGAARILLVGHVDTVYPAGAAQKQPFRVQDGMASGPGVLDMKSGVLLGLYMLRAFIESNFDQYHQLVLLFNNDEEVGSPGSESLIRTVAREVDYAFVLEPAGKPTSLTHARKGTDKYTLTVHGVAAHSGVEPYKGRSAVVELAHKILAIQNLHALFPGMTFNITRLKSSEALNVVPEMAQCMISVRAFSKRGLEAASHALHSIAATTTMPDTTCTLQYHPGRPPYEPNEHITHLVTIAQEEGEPLGLKLKAEPKGGVSDANFLIDAGVAALDTLGTVGGGMHNLALEHMKIESIALRGSLLAGLVQHTCLSHTQQAL
jgi:glutamate carboxypeptidase